MLSGFLICDRIKNLSPISQIISVKEKVKDKTKKNSSSLKLVRRTIIINFTIKMTMIRKWTYEINLDVNVESTSHKISKNHNKITKIMKSLPEQGEGGFGGVAGIRSQRGGGARQ